jgi:hypothetical protein
MDSPPETFAETVIQDVSPTVGLCVPSSSSAPDHANKRAGRETGLGIFAPVSLILAVFQPQLAKDFGVMNQRSKCIVFHSFYPPNRFRFPI